MIYLLSVISHYNRSRVSRDVMVRVVSGIRRLMLRNWIIFLHLQRVGFLYINGGNRMTRFQFYFKIFVLDIFLLILHSEERGRKWKWLRRNRRRDCPHERVFWKRVTLPIQTILQYFNKLLLYVTFHWLSFRPITNIIFSFINNYWSH